MNKYFSKGENIKIFWIYIVLFVFSLLILLPTLKIRFSWIDDGWDILYAKEILGNIGSINVKKVIDLLYEENLGRVRPMYWIWQTIIFSIAKYSSTYHYLIHSIVIIATLFIVFNILYHHTKALIISLLSSLLYLLLPSNIENWIRLGPTEPFSCLLIVSIIYFLLIKKNVTLSVILFVLAIYTKETNIILIAPIAIYYLINRIYKLKKVYVLKFIKYSFLVSIISFIIFSLSKGGYSNSYDINVSDMYYRFQVYLRIIYTYFPIIRPLILIFLFRLIYLLKNNKIKTNINEISMEVLALLLFYGYLVIQTPWIWVLERYMLPASIGLVIFVGLEIAGLVRIFQDNKYVSNFFISILLVLFLMYGFFRFLDINAKITSTIQTTQSLQNMFRLLSEKVPENAKVFMNVSYSDATMEPLLETAWNLKLFYNRDDINILSMDKDVANEGDYIINGDIIKNLQYIPESELNTNTKYEPIGKVLTENKYIVYGKPFNAIKRLLKNILGGFAGKGFNTDGVYSDYNLRNYWVLYKING